MNAEQRLKIQREVEAIRNGRWTRFTTHELVTLVSAIRAAQGERAGSITEDRMLEAIERELNLRGERWDY